MTRILGVLFDWGDTLFSPPDAANVIVTAAEERGIPITAERARALWDELWEAGKMPEELAKGRDLSADAHREIWTGLFERAETADTEDGDTHRAAFCDGTSRSVRIAS